MRKNNILIFDDFVVNPQSGTEVYTSAELEATLGAYDVVAVQIVLDTWNVTSATLSVFQQHSADAKNWVLKNGGAAILTVTTPSTPGGPARTDMGADTTGVPSLAFVRFQMRWTTGTGVNARVRLYATLRDQGAG